MPADRAKKRCGMDAPHVCACTEDDCDVSCGSDQPTDDLPLRKASATTTDKTTPLKSGVRGTPRLSVRLRWLRHRMERFRHDRRTHPRQFAAEITGSQRNSALPCPAIHKKSPPFPKEWWAFDLTRAWQTCVRRKLRARNLTAYLTDRVDIAAGCLKIVTNTQHQSQLAGTTQQNFRRCGDVHAEPDSRIL